MKNGLIKEFKKDNLTVLVFESREQMGCCAADDIAACIEALFKEKDELNVIFAAAPSQNDTLSELCKKALPWEKINALHMDEYVGLDKNHPQSFGRYLYDHIFSRVPFKSVKYISDYGESYAEILKETPIDIICMGIGENGHIAFNDPLLIKKVKLDDVCRMQQVHDGCFPAFDDVPEYALTLTVPQMVSADYMFCVVPAQTKKFAVERMINGEISEDCPATILRRHSNAVLYCDSDSGELILK